MSVTSTYPTTTEASTIDPRCSLYYQNTSGLFIKDYEGIPETLVLNLVTWVALVVLFTFIRRIGDYGRFGLIRHEEEKYVYAGYKCKICSSSSC